MVIKTAFQIFFWLRSQQLHDTRMQQTDNLPKFSLDLNWEELYLLVIDSDFVKREKPIVPQLRPSEHRKYLKVN